MPEAMNVEVAHHLVEEEAHNKHLRLAWLEITEAVVLSLIAIATALSGYEAAKWDGRQGFLYGTSVRLRVEAAAAATEGGQQRLLDVATFNTWIVAHESKNENLADLYARRFSPEYRVAFEAWLKTDPFARQDAPVGPAFMPEYHNALLEKSARLDAAAQTAFAQGTEARVISEKFVRGSVLLAIVIFLVALAQRFKIQKVRVGLIIVSSLVMTYALAMLATYPRLHDDPSQTIQQIK
jgi:hypothetical protein